jgi:hypothetical protein
VILLDANILISAWNRLDPRHPRIKEWTEGIFRQGDLVGIPWVTMWAFLRVVTSPRVFVNPLDPATAFAMVQHWIDLPAVIIPEPGPRHLLLLNELVREGQATGSLVTDAVLAAITIETNGTLASTDRDFARFKGLAWIDPLSEGSSDPT